MLKKLVLNILMVAAVVFLLDFAIGRTLRHFYFKERSGVHYRTTYAIDSTTADFLIFGASRATHHYVPGVFEDSLKQTYYNTGKDGTGMIYQIALLESILKRHIPKEIVLDFSGDFKKDPGEYDKLSALLPYYNTHEQIKPIVELRSPFEKIKLLSQIYPYNSQPLTIAVGNLEINKTRGVDNKGYIPLYNQWPNKIDSVNNHSIYPVDSVKVNVFRTFITKARNAGIRVFVIYSPVFGKFNLTQEINICSKVCAEENIPFWDFSNDPLFLNDVSLFQDEIHLNNKGAELFSKIVAAKIIQEKNKTAAKL
jgi:hypothetical protein